MGSPAARPMSPDETQVWTTLRHGDRLVEGSELRATSWMGQKREIRMRVLTHDLMILRRQLLVFDRASLSYNDPQCA
jgi:hypothetical protein